MLEVDGDILPHADFATGYNLGSSSLTWNGLFVTQIAGSSGVVAIDVDNQNLDGTQWNVTGALRVGDNTSSMPTGREFYVVGDASVSATFFAGGTSELLGTVTVGNGTGKIDVGTVDPPYTINGEKYATYMSGMIGVKEEVTGTLTTNEYLEGVGFKKTINLDQLPKGSDLWLFSKTTNLKQNLSRLSVLLTPKGQAKTWYEIDENTKKLFIYSSSPTEISYRFTAPRFDDATWTNTRIAGADGFIINDPDQNFTQSIQNEKINYSIQIANIDGIYKLILNNQEKKEVSSFSNSLIANLKAGIATVSDLVVDNLNINTKLISPLANIDQLTVVNATVSGNLYADNIKGKTIDKLTEQLGLLDEKYSTASAILASLREKVSEYGTDPLQISPLATTSATLPEDISEMNQSIIASDILANGSIFTPSLSSFDTDLFIQPSGDKPVHLLANLMTLYPNGQVAIEGDLLVTGNIFANNLDTRTATISGTLAVGNGQLASDSGKIFALFNDGGNVIGSVDASGSANFGQLTTGGLVIASDNTNNSSISGQTSSNSTVGTASIATSSSEIFVPNSKINSGTLVYITPISDTNNQVLYVKSKQVGNGFTVAVTSPTSSEVHFNYWLVQTN